MTKNRPVYVGFHMNGEKLDEYKRLAELEGRNFSSQTRFLIQQWMLDKKTEAKLQFQGGQVAS